MKNKKRLKKLIQTTVGSALFLLTLYLVFNVYAGISYAVELNANRSGITVDQTDLFNISNLYPGQPPAEAKRPLKIINNGVSDLQCQISSEKTSGDQALFNILKLCILDGQVEVYNGSLGGLDKLDLGVIRPRTSKTFDFTLELPANVDNSYQRLSTSFQFNIVASGGSGVDDGTDDNGGNNGDNGNNGNNSNNSKNGENKDYETGRLDGEDRTDTAIKISQEGWPNGALAVILSRDDDFPDALAGVPLSRKLDAPILLTNKDVLSSKTGAEITRLKAKTIYILGGPGAVSQEIQDYLVSKGLEVVRIGGINRFETAALIAKRLPAQGKAVLTYGYDFPDTLAISPWAASNSVPVLLTQRDYLPLSTLASLKELNVKETIVVGGSGVVSENVASSLPGMVRYAGANRYQTNLEILESLAGNNLSLCLATGEDFPDALVGAGLAAKDNSFIFLVDETLSEPKLGEFLVKHKGAIRFPYVFGGNGVVNEQVLEKIRSLKK